MSDVKSNENANSADLRTPRPKLRGRIPVRKVVAVLILVGVIVAQTIEYNMRPTTSVADWDTWTMPLLDENGGEAASGESHTVWRKDGVEYADTDQDGAIDTRTATTDGWHITWMDIDRDGRFDVEQRSKDGTIDPSKDVRAIDIPVPKTK